jgi:hypothetical protein
MKFTRNIVNYDNSCVFELVVDMKTLTLSVNDTQDLDFKETYASFEELENAYRDRVMPYFATHNCYDIDRRRPVDAAQPLRELRDIEGEKTPLARGKTKGAGQSMAKKKGKPMKKKDEGPIDRLVSAASRLLGRRLSAAIGPEPCRLESAVFLLDDNGIQGVVINAPGLRGISEKELASAVKKKGWCDGDFRDKAAWDLESNPLGGPALEPFGDPYNLYGRCFRQLMYLACARLEQAPNLKDNVEVMPGFRVLIGESEDPSPDFKLRAAARSHVDGPAQEYFEATRK